MHVVSPDGSLPALGGGGIVDGDSRVHHSFQVETGAFGHETPEQARQVIQNRLTQENHRDPLVIRDPGNQNATN